MASSMQQEQASRKARVLGGSFGLFYTWTRQGIFTAREFEDIIKDLVDQQVTEEVEKVRAQYGLVENSDISAELLKRSGNN